MLPNKDKITIDDNRVKIIDFIQEIIINPRQTLKKWSQVTRQTPSFKLGYIGQHLASLITGVQGTGSGARGDDLCDGTEVKSCNKIDQLDKCKKCGGRVLRYESACSNCGSTDIDRRDDSKWLFSVRSESELETYKNLDRILLILMDYPGFDNNDFDDIRISAYEIYPKDPRCKVFNQLIDNHYHNIYLPKIAKKADANPMNLHPFGYQFYKCNPTLVFQCVIKNVDDPSKRTISIDHYIEPDQIRSGSVMMPSRLLKQKEWGSLDFDQIDKILKKNNINLTKSKFSKLSAKEKSKKVPELDEKMREKLPLRDVISTEQHTAYKR